MDIISLDLNNCSFAASVETFLREPCSKLTHGSSTSSIETGKVKMDTLLPSQEHDDNPVSESLSEIELAELVTTKFVGQNPDQNTDQNMELVRAVGSPICFQSPIGEGNDGVILEEYECLRRPIAEEKMGNDGASQLLKRIQNATEEELQNVPSWNFFEKSKKWKKTSRDTELALINSTISQVDARPAHLHFFCRRLTESDIASVVEKALKAAPVPKKFRSLYRVNFKTDMPLKQFLGQLDHLYHSSPGMKVIEGQITAMQKNANGSIQKFLTLEITRFAGLEHILGNTAFCTMTTTARFEFGLEDNDHVHVIVEFHNEKAAFGRRVKTIMIEQHVKPPPTAFPHRRVTFGSPELVEVYEYSICDTAPFHPLGLSNKFLDLIEHLEKAPPSSGDAPRDAQFKNVTFR